MIDYYCYVLTLIYLEKLKIKYFDTIINIFK